MKKYWYIGSERMGDIYWGVSFKVEGGELEVGELGLV